MSGKAKLILLVAAVLLVYVLVSGSDGEIEPVEVDVEA
jgi:tellurite resistance protein